MFMFTSSLDVREIGERLGLELRQLLSQELDFFSLFLGLVKQLSIGANLLKFGLGLILAGPIFAIHLLNLLPLFDSAFEVPLLNF